MSGIDPVPLALGFSGSSSVPIDTDAIVNLRRIAEFTLPNNTVTWSEDWGLLLAKHLPRLAALYLLYRLGSNATSNNNIVLSNNDIRVTTATGNTTLSLWRHVWLEFRWARAAPDGANFAWCADGRKRTSYVSNNASSDIDQNVVWRQRLSSMPSQLWPTKMAVARNSGNTLIRKDSTLQVFAEIWS